jgi:aspartate/methionine/tyrosine aminotransferase
VLGAVPVAVPLRAENKFRWTREELEQHITKQTRAILFNSPHNPTGTVHTADDLDMIAGLAQDHNFYIISDEVYEKVTWDDRRHICIAGRPAAGERAITVMGLSKTFSMGGWRIGFVFGSEFIVAAMVKLQQHLLTCAVS